MKTEKSMSGYLASASGTDLSDADEFQIRRLESLMDRNEWSATLDKYL